jgi:peptidoglycan hydrolase-like protein with peptidoglycan-binding domain
MTSDGRTEFTKDIATAVRFFQAYNNLTVTGRADDATIKTLKSKIH